MTEPGDSRAREYESLPAWRHGLSREYVAANQRGRILQAVVDVNSLAGYGVMSVEDIVRTAGVSRRSFYELFDGKEDAFLAAFDLAAADLMAAIVRAAAGERRFAAGVRACVVAGVSFIGEDHGRADLVLVDAPAAGDAAAMRRRRIVRRLSALLRVRARALLDGPPPPALTAEAIVAGTVELIAARVARGDHETLGGLVDELVYAVLQPFLGRQAAYAQSGLGDGPVTTARADARA